MVSYGLPDMPPVINMRIDNRKKKNAIFQAYYALGKFLGAEPLQIIRAYFKFRFAQLKFQNALCSGMQPLEAFDFIFENKKIPRQ